MACVILLFNDYEKLTYKKIISLLVEDCVATGDNSEAINILESHILGMCNPRKAQVLIKSNTKKPTLAPDEILCMNEKFTNKTIKFTCVPMSTSSIDETLRINLEKQVRNERAMIVDAKLVKILKANKKLNESELLSRLKGLNLNWKPTDEEILMRLKDSLIDDKEWVEEK